MANGKSGAPLGNDNYRKGKMVEDALRKAAAQEDYARLRKGAEAVWDAFSVGESWAVGFVRDTFDGKPKDRAQVDITYRAIESLTEEQTRMMAEEWLARAARSSAHDSAE